MTREGRLGPRWAGPTLTAVSGWMLMTALASACDRPRDIEVRVDTLASGRLLVSNPDLAAVREGKTLELVEELRIGAALSDAADAPELFGRVLFLSVDEDENTYVADYRSNEIRVFGREGNFVRTIGRKGEGPASLADWRASSGTGRTVSCGPSTYALCASALSMRGDASWPLTRMAATPMRLGFSDLAGWSRFTRRLVGRTPSQLPNLPLDYWVRKA